MTAGKGEEGHRGGDESHRHQGARAIAVGQPPDERGQQRGAPGAGGDGKGQGAHLPAGVLGDEDLDTAQRHLRKPGGGEGGQEGHAQDQPPIVKGRPGPPVDDCLDQRNHLMFRIADRPPPRFTRLNW